MATETNENLKWTLSLDSEQFKAAAEQAGEALGQMGEAAELPMGALGQLASGAGIVVAAFAAAKAAIDMSERAEEIKAVNTQFNMLASNAGLAAGSLKQSFLDAADGLADDTTLLKAANQAIVTMGDSAGRLPEVMELAHKAASLTGGDITQTFNNLTVALASGRQETLRQYGIFVDNTKAVRDYAEAHQVAVSALSQTGKQQAVLNAAIDAGKTALANVSTELEPTLDLMAQLKATFKEVGDAISIAFDKVAGPAVSHFLSGLKEMAGDAKQYLTAEFGSGADHVNAQINRITDQIRDIKVKILDKENGQLGFFDSIGFNEQAAKAHVEMLQHMLDQLQKQKAEFDAKQQGDKKANASQEIVDQQAQANLQKKFQSDLLAEEQTTFKANLQNMKTQAEAEKAYDQQKLMLAEQTNQKIKAIELQYDGDDKKIKALKLAAERAHVAQLKAMYTDLQKYKEQAAQNDLQTTDNINEQLAASAQLNALKAADAWVKAGQDGGTAMTSFGKQSIAGFKAMGDGSKSASEAMKGIMLGTLGDIATAHGQFMILDAFKTFPAINIGEFAAGGALIALGGALGAAGGAATASVPSPSAGGNSAVGGSLSSTSPSASAQQQQQSKTVSLTVYGSIMGSDDTKMQILQMLRDASDATDYRYNQVGG